ncbi:UBA domain-containing protein 7 isoform X2 [Humulus lupulus]|uniref:UBA domain-containing protein 7 isoform X2 n=1 Tax=Humulus lupulus TaxID=3486 RepID=UPI002B40BA30|nr:UBA domain-containing protein 7 isoform X2 [Humulus lupulus]
MDESWRMPMSESPHSRRRSTEQAAATVFADSSHALDPEDFADVFGGPPRSVYWRKVSADFVGAASNSFYDEIFQPQESFNSGGIGRRGFPALRIPGGNDLGFYGDVFGSDGRDDGGERRSRERSRPNSNAKSKSKSTSSSVLSSEEMSPLRPVVGEHVALSDFASKLRRISSTLMHAEESLLKKQLGTHNINPTFFYGSRSPNDNNTNNSPVEPQFMETDQNIIHNWNSTLENKSSSQYFGFSRRVSSPETVSVKISLDDVDEQLNSPASSAVSSLCHDGTTNQSKSETHGTIEEEWNNNNQVDQHEDDEDDEDDDDEAMSSYVIEIGSDYRERTPSDNAVGIDDAIAWAKERFQTYTTSIASEKNLNTSVKEDKESSKLVEEEMRNSQEQTDNKHEIVQPSESQMEMRLQDENIRLWSSGKERDIRLLLSTLHYILWPNSGWSAISLTKLIESSQVKKAYQKARLCLHPDKLQQRGVTLPQKYVADKAFSILQDAWASFISQDVF